MAEPGGQAWQIAYAVVIGISEAARIDLIDAGPLPPGADPGFGALILLNLYSRHRGLLVAGDRAEPDAVRPEARGEIKRGFRCTMK